MSDEEKMRLAERLRDAREKKGLLQEDVAKHLGIPRPAVSQLENGNRKVDALELARLAKLYEQPLSFFADDAEEEPRLELLKRTAAELSQRDRDEVLRFAQFLRQRSMIGKKKQ